MKLSIIIVSWNVKALLRQLLHSILSSRFEDDLEIIVVDSASHDGSPAMVEAMFPQVKLITSDKNLGFAQGNNVGTQAASGELLFFLNPDTVVAADALAQLSQYLIDHPEVGVVGPKLLYPSGDIQSSRRRFPTLGSMFWESTLLEQWWPHNPIAQHYKFVDQPNLASMSVDWLVGAALFMRREVWQAVGPFDENLFMYFEETDWCRRCANTAWAIHYVPQAEIVHYEGQSSQQVVAERTMRFQRSKIRYAHKWFGWQWAWAVRFFLLATFAFQWLEETLKWLLGHKRPLRHERMVAYWQVLKSRLV